MNYYILKVLLLCCIICVNSNSFSQQRKAYINKVWGFQGNHEFYLPLQLKDSVAHTDPFEFLKTQTDSIISANTYQQRKRLLADTAREYFELDILQTIAIYNSGYDFLTDATFKHVEYFEDMIDGMFIAVFEPANKNLDVGEMELFCLAGDYKSLVEKTKTEEVTKKKWDEKTRDHISFDQESLLTIRHYEIKQNGTTVLTALSVQNPDTFETSSFLISRQGQSLTVLKQMKEEQVIWDVLPTPLAYNQKPVLLVEMVIPQTDFTGYTLGIFNGTGYELHDSMKFTY